MTAWSLACPQVRALRESQDELPNSALLERRPKKHNGHFGEDANGTILEDFAERPAA
jgi:hypothetical protein